MKNRDTIGELFRLSIITEKKMMDFYRRLDRLFSRRPRIRDFWKSMRKDERDHIEELKRVCGTLSPETLSNPADPELIRSVQRLLDELQEELKEPIKDLDQAYELAHRWETSEINRIFLFLAEKFVKREDRKEMVEKMIDQHLEKLMNFVPGYRTALERKSFRAQ